jgi:hypothetical protein
MQKSKYVVYLDNSCVVISNLACKECFENEYKCKIRSFSKIDYVKNKDAIYVKNICKCNKNSTSVHNDMDNQQGDVDFC